MSRKAIYPGTFDPITLGHINILEKAAGIFEHVVLAVSGFTGKSTLFSLEERTELCRESARHLSNVTVMPFTGLVVDFAKSQSCHVLIRGMRAVSDFEYEFSLALANKKLSPRIETIFLVPSLKYLYLSSSIIKQAAQLKGNLSDLVPRHVAIALADKFK